MKIGIDISQLAYPSAGVSNYLQNLVENLLKEDMENEYVLFFSSLRNNPPKLNSLNPRVSMKTFKYPPKFLSFLWNRLHVLPIEELIGDIDLFVTSDWTEPPTRNALKATILYDLIVYKSPEETAKLIVETQKKKLDWVKKESAIIFCISESTKKDAEDILGIEKSRLKVIYPGL